ncbi:MAG TPA: MFS transporter [Pseudonocardiaceae bacterium]
MTSKQQDVTTTASGTAAPATSLVQVRIAITLFFALGGFVFAGWAVRIPSVKQQIDASPGILGLALLALSASAVATMSVSGAVCRRFGSQRVTVVAGLLLCTTVVLPTLAHSAVVLGLALLVFGVAYGGIDVAINSVAVDLVAALRRPIMPSLHAANSIGSLAGAGLGGLLATYLSPTAHMLLTLPVGVLVTFVAGRMLLANPIAPHRDSPSAAGRTAKPTITAGVLIFGVIGLCAAYSQGGLDNWVPLHLTGDLRTSAGVAAAGYAIVQGTMAVGRLSGVALVERFNRTRVMVVGGALACAGTLLGALSPVVWLAFIGLAATGIGLANIFPLAMGGAGAIGGPGGVAVAATLGYAGILLAPPTIGFLADQFGLRVAMLMIALMVAIAVVISYAIRRTG